MPKRVVSLAPSITREMYDLGAEDMLVGVTCFRPACASCKAIVGSLTQLNMEKLVGLKPDMVMVSKDSNRKRDVFMIKNLGIPVRVFETQANLDDICREFIKLGLIVGREKRARDIVDDVRGKVISIKDGLKHKKRPRVFWQVGLAPIVSTNDKTFIGSLTRVAGAINIFGNAPMRYPRVNKEEVILRDPDIILIVRGMDSASKMFPIEEWEDIKGLKAVRKGRIYEVDSDILCQPTPYRFLDALKIVVDLIYKGGYEK